MTWDELDAKYGGAAGGAPDTLDELDKRFAKSLKGPPEKPKAEPVTDFSGNLRLGPLDTGIPLPQFVNKRLAQLGSGIADWTTRLDQLTGNATTQQVDEKRKLDAGLRDDFTGKALGVAGRALPAFAIPFAAGAPITSGVLGGGAMGFMSPVGTGESATANTALGAALGGVLPAAAAGFRAIARPDAATADTIRKAERFNIPVGIGDVSRNGLVKGATSLTNDLPVLGLPGQMLKARQQEALNEAVGAQFGAQAKRLTPDVVDSAKQRMGAEFDRIWGRNSLTVDAPLFGKLTQAQQLVNDLPPAQAARLQKEIDGFFSKMQPGPGGAPTVSGDAANLFQQWLRKQSSGQPDAVKEALGELRQAVIQSFNRSVGPADAAALTMNRTQYKAFKTVEPLLDKGAVGTAGRAEGDIPATLLPEAVRRSYSGLSSQQSGPALADIAQVAGRLLTDRTPQTGGSARAALQNMGIGGALAAGGSVAPLTTGVASGATMAGNWLLNSPAARRALLDPPRARGLLAQPSLEDMTREAAMLTLGRSPVMLPGLLN